MLADEMRKQLMASRGRDLKAVVEAVIRAAKDGDVQAIKAIFDRIDGPVANILTGANSGPIQLEWLDRGSSDEAAD